MAVGANEKHDAAYHDGNYANHDPEKLHDQMVARGFEPWVKDPSNDEQKELEELGIKEKPKAAQRQELGRGGKIVAGLVAFALFAPLVALLWHWVWLVVFP